MTETTTRKRPPKAVVDVDLPDNMPDPDAPTVAMIGHHQLRVLSSLAAKHGMRTDTALHDYLTLFTGREIASRKELTAVETAHVLADLDQRPAAPQSALAAALVEFQAEIPKVAKGKTATVPMKAGGQYRYTYADLGDVCDAAYPLLVKHGLAFIVRPRHVEGRTWEAVGVLLHTSGEYEEGSMPLSGGTPQEWGSSLTYARRYLLGSMTGIVTEDDDDGSIAQAQRDREARERAEAEHAARQPSPSSAWNPSTEDCLTEIDRIAGVLGKTREEVTAKWRTENGDMPLADMSSVPPDYLMPLIHRLRAYADTPGGSS